MTVYSGTSTIGGCFDEEFKAGVKLFMLSDLTLPELEFAPREVREKLNEIPNKHRVPIGTTDGAIELAETYISEGALTNKSYNDALHVALATFNNASVLASWNFKHIVNLNRIRLYNSINLKPGYRMIEIRTPREILKPNDNE